MEDLAAQFPFWCAKELKKEKGYETIYPGRPRHDKLMARWKELGRPQRFEATSVGVTFMVEVEPYDKDQFVFKEYRGYLPLPWHVEFMKAKQPFKTIIGVPGTGKTHGVGIMAMFYCSMIPNFKFLNVAPTHYQSKLMVDSIWSVIDQTPFIKKYLLDGKKGFKSNPAKFSFRNGSTAEFLNVDTGARNIQSWGGDWINIDEAGLLNTIDATGTELLATMIPGLVSRLRGIRPDGKPRMGQLSMITMAYPCATVKEQYDLAEVNPSWYYSALVLHDQNPYYGYDDLNRLRKSLKPGDEMQWIYGQMPRQSGTEFDAKLIDEMFSIDPAEDAICNVDSSGLVVEYHENARPGRVYCVAGDPGTNNPPHRNAPALLVFDVTDVPKEPARLVHLWWGYGNGSYTPFVDHIEFLMDHYRPPDALCGYDSTSSQSAMADLLWATEGRAVRKMGFEGAHKYAHLNSAKMALSKYAVKVPHTINSLKRQLLRYTMPDKKIAQDLVSAFCLACSLIMEVYGVSDDSQERIDEVISVDFLTSAGRLARWHSRERAAITRENYSGSGKRFYKEW